MRGARNDYCKCPNSYQRYEEPFRVPATPLEQESASSPGNQGRPDRKANTLPHIPLLFRSVGGRLFGRNDSSGNTAPSGDKRRANQWRRWAEGEEPKPEAYRYKDLLSIRTEILRSVILLFTGITLRGQKIARGGSCVEKRKI